MLKRSYLVFYLLLCILFLATPVMANNSDSVSKASNVLVDIDNLSRDSKLVKLSVQKVEPEIPLSDALTITDIKIRNENGKGSALSDFQTQFKKREIRYIDYYVTMKNETSKSITGKIQVKYIKQDGTLARSTYSPTDCTFEQSFTIPANATIEKTAGWGNMSGGSFERGTHNIEFWWKDIRLAFIAFNVY